MAEASEPTKRDPAHFTYFPDHYRWSAEMLAILGTAPYGGADLSEQELTELACRIYESRRLRARFLSLSLLGEPVWDMVLALYCFSARGRRMSVSSLCYASGVPPTTALRWIGVMEERDLVCRSKDHRDGRKTYLHLTEQGKQAMQLYLRSIHNSLRG